MADYRTIADIEVEQGRVATSQTAFAFRDNTLAIIEGTPGAPHINPWSMTQTTVAGDQLRYHEPGEWHTDSEGGDVQAALVMVLASGSVRMSAAHRGNAGADGGAARMQFIHIRGSTVTSQGVWTRNDGDGFATRTADVTVLPGDALAVLHRRNSGAGISRVGVFSLLTSGAYLFALGGGAMVMPPEPS